MTAMNEHVCLFAIAVYSSDYNLLTYRLSCFIRALSNVTSYDLSRGSLEGQEFFFIIEAYHEELAMRYLDIQHVYLTLHELFNVTQFTKLHNYL